MTIKHIGLLNIQRCDSHGAVLLVYAMEHFLLEEGYAVNTIDYKYAGRIVDNNVLKKLINKLLIKWKKQLHMSYANKTVCGESVKSEYDIQHSHFEEFRKNLLTLTKEVRATVRPAYRDCIYRDMKNMGYEKWVDGYFHSLRYYKKTPLFRPVVKLKILLNKIVVRGY